MMNADSLNLPISFLPKPPSGWPLLPRFNKKYIPLLESCPAVVVAAFPYFVPSNIPPNTARFAAIPDYHLICSQILHSIIDAPPLVDNSPFDEVSLAVLAGLGSRGEHNLLITPQFGSFVFIGVLALTSPIPPKNIPTLPQKTDLCLHCHRCQNACPTKALPSHDYSLCLSLISQKKSLSPSEASLLHSTSTIWGCDRCQLACPVNANLPISPIPQFVSGFSPTLTLDNLPTRFQNAPFAWRGIQTIKRNLLLSLY